MSFSVITSHEEARGCGFRKAGGYYLVAEGLSTPCGRLPIPIQRCPCCGEGVKFSRGTTWLDPRPFAKIPCSFKGECPETTCPAFNMDSLGRTDVIECSTPKKVEDAQKKFRSNFRYEDVKVGVSRRDRSLQEVSARFPHVLLLWIGEKFYATPEDFINEAKKQGVSRRIPTVPHDFEAGETWVWLAHLKAIYNGPNHEDGEYTPGVFHMFRPKQIDYIVDKENDDDYKLERLAEKGYRLVDVVKIGEQAEF